VGAQLALGAAIGVAGVWWMSKLVAMLLYGLAPTDARDGRCGNPHGC